MRALACVFLLFALASAPAHAQQAATCADDDAVCAEASMAQPAVEVAGVQTTPSDARQIGEDEPFIINDGFGD